MKVSREEFRWRYDVETLWPTPKCPTCGVDITRWIETERHSTTSGRIDYSIVITDPCGHRAEAEPLYSLTAPDRLALRPTPPGDSTA